MLLISPTSYATKPKPPPNEPPTADARATATSGDSRSESRSDSSSAAEASSSAQSTSGSDANANLSTGDTRQEININEQHPDDITLRNVASPDTPNPYPTAPCRIGVSAGLSLAGGALSGGGSVEDTECTLRETARSFADLGVPEVGLYLLCTQSVVTNGRRDKKGKMEENQPNILGSKECLRLVRDFQGDNGDSGSEGAYTSEVQKLRQQQDRIERELFARVERIEQQAGKVVRDHEVEPEPKTEVIYQPFLDNDKKSRLAAIISEDEITESGDEQ